MKPWEWAVLAVVIALLVIGTIVRLSESRDTADLWLITAGVVWIGLNVMGTIMRWRSERLSGRR